MSAKINRHLRARVDELQGQLKKRDEIIGCLNRRIDDLEAELEHRLAAEFERRAAVRRAARAELPWLAATTPLLVRPPTSLVRQVVQSVELRNPPFPVHIEIARTSPGQIFESITVFSRVHDRDSGDEITIRSNFDPPDLYHLRIDRLRAADEIVEWLHECICRVFMHEVNEAFHRDGKRYRDPHWISREAKR